MLPSLGRIEYSLAVVSNCHFPRNIFTLISFIGLGLQDQRSDVVHDVFEDVASGGHVYELIPNALRQLSQHFLDRCRFSSFFVVNRLEARMSLEGFSHLAQTYRCWLCDGT